MNEPVVPALTAAAAEAGRVFEPYTVFAAAEEALEQHLGDKSKLELPERQRQSFVKYLPWIALLFLPVHFAAVLLLLGISALATLAGSSSSFGALISTGIFALDVIALPGLFAKTRRGWAFYVYAITLSILGSLLSLSLFGLLFNAAFLWIAFQIKYSYR